MGFVVYSLFLSARCRRSGNGVMGSDFCRTPSFLPLSFLCDPGTLISANNRKHCTYSTVPAPLQPLRRTATKTTIV